MAGVDPTLELQAEEREIDELQRRIVGLQEKLQEGSDPTERNETERAIASQTLDLQNLQSHLARTLATRQQETETRTRKSSRERRPTQRMIEHQEEETEKRERKFFKCYGLLKTNVKGAREAVKVEVQEEVIENLTKTLEAGEAEMLQIFNEIRTNKPPSQEVRTKMDRASAMVHDVLNALAEVLGSLTGPFDADDRGEIAQQLLKHDYGKSVYGSTASRATKDSSANSVHSERVRLEAQLAGKEVEVRKNAEIEAHRAKVQRMEQARDVEAMKAQLKVYRRAESGDGEEGRPHGPDIDNDVATQHSSEGSHMDARHSYHTALSSARPQDNVEARASQVLKSSLSTPPSQAFDTSTLAQALSDTMQRNRLPVPVPQVFSGNPLDYIEFERSFKTLIESRGIPPGEKLYYLKQYVTGPAKEAIEGFFYGATLEAYEGAWKTLQERYGHPFKIQQAFRAKLSKWPKINTKDALSLQKFARQKNSPSTIYSLKMTNPLMRLMSASKT